MTLPHVVVMRSDLRLKGIWMYEPEDIRVLIKIVEV